MSSTAAMVGDVRAAHVVLSRLGYGPAEGEAARFVEMGLQAWLEGQLKPVDGDDARTAAALKAAKLRIAYEAGKNDEGDAYEARDEERGLEPRGEEIAKHWWRTKWNKGVAWAERVRPLAELRCATVIRARESSYQLREVMVDFWHNHFHVNAGGDDIRASVAMPWYDRDVIRRHCLGNFREFVEAVASHPAMLAYLNNASSKASPANENFARELFELHTLGRGAYLNALFNRWRDVPGAMAGNAEGYIDQDVYEAARAFTGWTIADGGWNGMDNGRLPDGGAFLYMDAWHDHYQKRVLASEFDPSQPPLADGRKVLDLVAFHPATAKHVCMKLCRRLLMDEPTQALVERVVAVWNEHAKAKDQIARVVRAIVMSDEFAKTSPGKAKRPLELAMSFARVTGAKVRADNAWSWSLEAAGQPMFAWPAPTGLPDVSSYWLSTSMMVSRWNMPILLMADWFKGTRVRLMKQMPDDADTAAKVVAFWSMRMIGMELDEPRRKVIERLVAGDDDVDAVLDVGEGELAQRVQRAVVGLAMSPEFQVR
jgi:uncharacterized protein (DUF1800 family)